MGDGKMSHVMMVEAPKKMPGSTPAGTGILQRKYDKCGKKDDEQNKGVLKRSAVRESPEHVPPIVHEVLRKHGHPLDAGTRAFMEPRFGHDFSDVRIHTETKAAESARVVNAFAYTVGQDVVFRDGQYAPGTASGSRLLAHELSHVLQQSQNNTETLSRMPDRTEPTQREVRRDEFLRGLARRPSEALSQWRQLQPGEQTVVATYMAMYYGLTFAQRFADTARRHRRPETVINITNFPEFTPERLQRSGYRFLGSFERIEYWVHPSGNEIWVIRSALSASSSTSPQSSTNMPPDNPPHMNTSGDPETAYGRRLADRADADIMGSHGYAVRYADGTIELYREGTTGSWTYRPRPGGGYDFYDENGNKTEGVILAIDPDEIFGTAGGRRP
jgi:hypothetical protein